MRMRYHRNTICPDKRTNRWTNGRTQRTDSPTTKCLRGLCRRRGNKIL